MQLLHTCFTLFVVFHKSILITAGKNNSQAIVVKTCSSNYRRKFAYCLRLHILNRATNNTHI